MKSLLKSCATAILLSLTVASAANALSITNQKTSQANPETPQTQSVESEFLIAAPFRKELSPAYQKRKRLMDLLVQQMKASEVAEEALQSEDPEVKRMAQEILSSSDAMSMKIIQMLDADFRKNPGLRDALQ